MISMDEIYRQYSRMIYAFLLSKTNDGDIAEELTQETFYRAIKNVESYQRDSKISTWLCGIAGHVWQEYLRKNKRQEIDGYRESSLVVPSAESQLLENWDSLKLLKILHHLKDPAREVIYLRLIGNLSFRDIGEIMEKSETWARVTFYRGKLQILEEVNRHDK